MKRLILCSLFMCFVSACAGATSYDGKWWSAASKDERIGFLARYIDCAVYDAGQKSMNDASWDLLEPKITKIYRENTSDLKKPVAAVLLQLSTQRKPQQSKNAENYSEKHGIFDGEYWRQLLDGERLGFIEGYIACQKEYDKPAAAFSREARWYVAQL